MSASVSSFRQIFVAIILLVLATAGLHAQIVLDRASSGTSNDGGNTLTFSHQIASGSKRLLVALVTTEDDNVTEVNISSVTYNGVAMTLVTNSRVTHSNNGAYNQSAIYYLLNASLPSSGTYNVHVTTAGPASIIAGVVSVSGARQQGAEAVATNTSVNDTISTNITTQTNGAWIFDVISNAGASNTITPTGTDMVERFDLETTGHSAAGSTRTTTTAGTFAMSWSTSASGREAHSVAAFAPALQTISGRVFEDVNYSGGAGRSYASSSGSARSGARVEVFNSTGDFVSATTTDGSGNYSFTVGDNSSYTVRVVNSTVTSSLGGTSLIPVQTYRTTATTGSAVAVTDRVGGEDPKKADAGNGSTTLASLTTGSITPQSITSVTLGTSNISGIDFGYNFSTIVNTNDSGQGSLRQFIINTNGMSGTQTSRFMISDGAAHAGLRSGLTNQLTSGVAVITLTSALPDVTGTVVIDGTSQTTNVGNTNSGSLGTGGTVGVDSLTLSTVNRPEVEIVGSSGLSNGINVQAANCTIKGISIHGFGSSTWGQADIRVGGVSGVTITQNVIGASATSFTAPVVSTGGWGIYTDTVTSLSVTNNLVGFVGYTGIHIGSNSASSVTIQNNEVRSCGTANSAYSGIDLLGSSHSVTGNLLVANKGQGLDLYNTAGGSTTVVNNTIHGNGVGNESTWETSGVRLVNSNNTVDRNQIYSNYGAGILVGSSATGNKFTRNSIYSNGTITSGGGSGATGQVGIDLLDSTNSSGAGTAPFYTLNDDGDGDAGGNGLINTPVIDTATIIGSNLELTGWVRAAGATIEFFISDDDPSGFGEGQTFLASYTEGGGSDTDATTGSYSGNVNCVAQGADSSVQRFKFTFAKPASVSIGSKLTATATDTSNNTSEFSYHAIVYDNLPDFTVVKSSQTISDPINAATNPKAIPGGVVQYSVIVTNSAPAHSDANTLVFTDAVPTDTALFVGDLGGAGSGPIVFTDGADSSALTYTFTSLTNTTDSLSFSNDGGSTWAYNPTPDADGYDANVTNIRIAPTGSFAKATCGNTPSFTLQFRVRVE